MIDHVGIPCGDLQRSRAFYERALAPLGYRLVHDYGEALGFGMTQHADFWLSASRGPVAPVHVALRTMDREAVDSFHREALAAGGKENGPPGIRANYAPTYYAAFVFDPDGHNVEAVCHCPEGE